MEHMYKYADWMYFGIPTCLQGGMRAVIWTDVFQCVAMLGGLLAIMIRVG